MTDVFDKPAARSIRIAIPAFNEMDRLPVFLDELERVGVLGEPGVEVVVVDDGSEAGQSEAMAKAVEQRRGGKGRLALRYMRLTKNRGKGGAVYAAWDEPGDVDLLALLDSDGAVPAYEAKRLLRMAMENPERAILASRVRMLGRRVERHLKRHLTGRVFATMVGTLIHEGIYDSQCGLKIVPAAAYRRVRNALEERRFVFDVELVVALLDLGCQVQEVPIDWRDVPGSKVRLVRDSLEMFFGVLRIARRRRTWALKGFR